MRSEVDSEFQTCLGNLIWNGKQNGGYVFLGKILVILTKQYTLLVKNKNHNNTDFKQQKYMLYYYLSTTTK